MKRVLLFVFAFMFCLGGVMQMGALTASAVDPGSQHVSQDQLDEIAEKCPEEWKRGCLCKETIEMKDLATLGKCVDEKTECTDGTVYYSCCVCEQPVADKFGQQKVPVKVADQGYTKTACQEACKKMTPPATVSTQNGAGRLASPPSAKAAPSDSQIKKLNATCFTAAECASSDYGGSPSAFQPGQGCPAGQGKCLAPEPEIPLSFAIGGVKSVKGIRGYVMTVFSYLVNIGAVVAAIMFVYGGFRYILGSSSGDFKSATEIMIDAAVGLVLILASVTILKTVNPDTLNMTRLNVYLMKKVQILSNAFCADIKSTAEKPIKFAEAGAKPAYNDPPADESGYNVEGKLTRCNIEYYVQGVSTDSKCWGMKCDEAGYACVSCRSGMCGEGVDKKGYGCIKATWAGTVSYKDGKDIRNIIPIAICNNALNPPKNPMDFETNKKAMKELSTVQTPARKGGNESEGIQTFSFDLTDDAINTAVQSCAGEGGIAGFVMGAVYHDGTFARDDVVIISKPDCNAEVADFAGYADGDATSFDFTDMKRGIWCGIFDGPRKLKRTSNMWSVDDLKTAIGAGGKLAQPILCNLNLSNKNVPEDPTSKGKKQAGCTGRASELNWADKALDWLVN